MLTLSRCLLGVTKVSFLSLMLKNTHTHTHIYKHSHTYINIYSHNCTYIYTCTHSHTYIHTHAHTCIHQMWGLRYKSSEAEMESDNVVFLKLIRCGSWGLDTQVIIF